MTLAPRCICIRKRHPLAPHDPGCPRYVGPRDPSHHDAALKLATQYPYSYDEMLRLMDVVESEDLADQILRAAQAQHRDPLALARKTLDKGRSVSELKRVDCTVGPAQSPVVINSAQQLRELYGWDITDEEFERTQGLKGLVFEHSVRGGIGADASVCGIPNCRVCGGEA